MSTIADVARKSRVSMGTVSNVLNNPDKVKPVTRERVLKVIEELNFYPNLSARNLSRLKTDTIALIYPFSIRRRTEHYYSDFLAGITETCFRLHYRLLLSSYPPNLDEKEKLNAYSSMIASRAVDGVIITRSKVDDNRIKLLVEKKQKFVVLGRSNLPLDFPWVDIDGNYGINEAVRYLSSLGHRRIAYIGTPDIFMFSRHRFEGYKEGLTAAGLDYDPSLVVDTAVGDDEIETGERGIIGLLKSIDAPRAVIVAGSQLAIGALKGIEKFGYEVGKDVSVVCFDAASWNVHYTPPITSIRQPLYEAGKRVARLLIEHIKGIKLEYYHILLKPELIIRESCRKQG